MQILVYLPAPAAGVKKRSAGPELAPQGDFQIALDEGSAIHAGDELVHEARDILLATPVGIPVLRISQGRIEVHGFGRSKPPRVKLPLNPQCHEKPDTAGGLAEAHLRVAVGPGRQDDSGFVDPALGVDKNKETLEEKCVAARGDEVEQLAPLEP